MATITFKGNNVHTSGSLPAIGDKAPDFTLTAADLKDVSLADFAGKVKIFNITPSLDTGVCAASARRFDREAASLPDAVVINVSRDLPFAASRFCGAENLSRIVTLSEMRNRDFGKAWGCEMTDGPLAGLLSRAVVVVDRNDRVVYTQQVGEIAQEPDYAPVLKAAREA